MDSPTLTQDLSDAGRNATPDEFVPNQIEELCVEHAAAVAKTKEHEMKWRSKTDLRNHAKKIMDWMMKEYPERAKIWIRQLTEDEMQSGKFYKNKHDFVYDKIEVAFIQAFMSSEVRSKSNGKQYSERHVTKFHDAIVYGAKQAEVNLPYSYTIAMKTFKISLKKEKKKAKQDGELDEEEADPISSTLCTRLCEWMVEEDLSFVWAFSLTQWACMARSASIDPLAWHNIEPGLSDCVKVTYDMSKADGTGERVSPKHLYGNPHDYRRCWFLSMCIYLSLNSDKFEDKDQDSLFLLKKEKPGQASSRYCKALSQLATKHNEIVKEFVRMDHFHAHGNRKGAATESSCGVTNPLPLVSILQRGEWLIGQVLDIYMKWAAQGDTYLGRILAGLDPDSLEFDVLPPPILLREWRTSLLQKQ